MKISHFLAGSLVGLLIGLVFVLLVFSPRGREPEPERAAVVHVFPVEEPAIIPPLAEEEARGLDLRWVVVAAGSICFAIGFAAGSLQKDVGRQR